MIVPTTAITPSLCIFHQRFRRVILGCAINDPASGIVGYSGFTGVPATYLKLGHFHCNIGFGQKGYAAY